jgi:crotonobetainyl-CoA:carnitine CoA-transferase CaiB-like acyl-CoA transferase
VIYDGLRVLDRSSSLAGAYCAKLLADLGADVVVAEADGGDARRDDGIDGAMWDYLHTSQRSVSRATARSWESQADVVVRDRPANTDALVAVTISPFGYGGPDDALNELGFTEEVLQARSGALAGHGHMTSTPLTVAGRLGEYVAGACAALAAATAHRRASRTNRPETLDVSILEAMQLTMLTMPTLFARFPGGRMAAFRFVMIPGNEPCRDGNFAGITTNTVAQWKALARAMGRDDIAADPELDTMIGRFMHAKDVCGALNAWTGAHTAAEIEDACTEARVPVAVVGNGKLLLEWEHLREREVYVPQPGRADGALLRPRAPFRMHGVPARTMTPAPGVHEHDSDPPWSTRSAAATEPSATNAIGPKPLAGVKVLDFTAFWAGPFATAWFAAMGADVIKVESVQRPDGMRLAGSTRLGKPEAIECSPLFHASNLDKRAITLDLTRPDGVDLAKRLAARCDVVCENFTPRVIEEFGLDYHVLRAIKADIIMLRLPAFGLTGPWRERPGFAQTMEQLCGMAWATGYEDGPPIIAGGVVDPFVGAHAALALVAALAHHDRTGEGQLVELPMVDVATAATADQVLRYQLTGELGGRRGAHGVYRCAGDDSWIAIVEARDPMGTEARAQWCATRSPADAESELVAEGIPACAVVPGYAAVDDRQMAARSYFEPLTHAVVGEQLFPGFPVRFSDGPQRYWQRPAPMLGEHNREVLTAELGLSDADLERLEADHIIGTAPIA